MLRTGRVRRVRPAPEPAGLPPVYAVMVYADRARALLLAHKERGVLPLAAELGVALSRGVRRAAQALPSRARGALSLVPVPSARSSVARRGHDPMRRVARAAAGRLRRDGQGARVLPMLRQLRAVADQSGLDAAQRRTNVRGALAVGSPQLTGVGPVILVDDLMTTGVSLAEAARAVRVAGGWVAGAAVIAAPERASPGRIYTWGTRQ